jgi:hypothetical protein
VVEQIEKLRPKSQALPLGELEDLSRREVDILLRRPAYTVA